MPLPAPSSLPGADQKEQGRHMDKEAEEGVLRLQAALEDGPEARADKGDKDHYSLGARQPGGPVAEGRGRVQGQGILRRWGEGVRRDDAARDEGRTHRRLRQDAQRPHRQEAGAIERTFAVIKRVFRAGHMLVTTVPRVKVKMLFSCLCFNLMQMLTLLRRRQAQAWDLDEGVK